MKRSERRTGNRAGFTLVELMVVMIIIGILGGILYGAIQSAQSRARELEVTAEIKSLEQSLNDFKVAKGRFPPSFIRLYEDGYNTMSGSAWDNTALDPLCVDSKAKIRALWPNFDFNRDRDINCDGDTVDVIELSGAECLVFFLGGVSTTPQATVGWSPKGFSKIPADPFYVQREPAYDPNGLYTAPDNNREGPFFDFKPNRLVNVSESAILGNFVNMPEYLDPYRNQQSPIVYVSSREGLGYPVGSLTPEIIAFRVFGTAADLQVAYYQKLGTSGVIDNTATPWNPKTFQLISPGRDNTYGLGGLYVDGTGLADPTDSAGKDNVTNFKNGMLK